MHLGDVWEERNPLCAKNFLPQGKTLQEGEGNIVNRKKINMHFFKLAVPSFLSPMLNCIYIYFPLPLSQGFFPVNQFDQESEIKCLRLQTTGKI